MFKQNSSFNPQEFITDILKESDPVKREEKLAAELVRMGFEIDGLTERLKQEIDTKGELEVLLKTNPDTNLPIYRVLVQRLEEMVEKGEAFWIAQLRLDAVYQRIKNQRDRSKALLFITTLRIKRIIGDTLYQSDRLDEFFILMEGDQTSNSIARILSSIEKNIELPHEGPAGDISFGANMGFVRFPEHGGKPSELLTNLDTALRHGAGNRKRIIEFTQVIGDAYDRQLRIETDLHRAIQSGFENFYLVYQPFVDSKGLICGCESLIRWKHPEYGMIPPPHFIPIAERNGDIRFFGRWILYKSLMALRAWRTQGFPDLFVSVNLSPVQFLQRDLVTSIQDALASADVPGGCLKLEITEGAIMSEPVESIEKMHTLKHLGIRLSIDDFGTGYSSLNYLRKLPIDTLKIDKSFIDDIASNIQNQEIVKAILAMAHSLGIETLAEGVEDSLQKDFLWKQGCKYIQGYYYSKPVGEPEFAEYLDKGAILAGGGPA